MSNWGARTSYGQPVKLNVYDIAPHNEYTHQFGIGAYHSGVEIGGREYTFASGSGIYDQTPKQEAPNAKFRESIEMGTFTGGRDGVQRILSELRNEFHGTAYNIVSKNCNSFSDAFCRQLVGKPIPGYVNRLAYFGSMFSCLLPPDMQGTAPVGNTNGAGSGSYGGSGGASGAPWSGGVIQRGAKPAFQGSGFRLAAGDGGASAANTGSSTSLPDSVEEKRERARAAALARLGGGGGSSSGTGAST